MKFSEEKIQECADWVRQNGLMDYGGATLKSFCEAMDIDKVTYYTWCNDSTFSTAIKTAKDEFKATQEKRLVGSLMESALGYEVTETRTEYTSDENGNRRPRKQTQTKKHVQSNTGAAIFLLTNIAPDKWKNKLYTEHSGELNTGLNIIVDSEDDSELIKEALKK